MNRSGGACRFNDAVSGTDVRRNVPGARQNTSLAQNISEGSILSCSYQ